MKKKRFFITFEGGEGSGKTTQIKRLAKRLKKERHPHIITREPGGTPIGEQIRKITHDRENVELYATTEAYLMAAARAQHVYEVIKPALKEKKVVVCDRFLDSSLVYQGLARGVGLDAVAQLNELATGKLEPDLTIYLDITPERGRKRKKERGDLDRLDEQSRDFYIKVYRGYRKLIQKNGTRFLVLDAESEPEVLEEKIWEEVTARLKGKK